MNFVLIPFFLVANIPDNHTDQWPHGPEYVFKVKLRNVHSTDLIPRPFYTTHMITSMNCRPKTKESLVCNLYDVVMVSFTENLHHNSTFNHPFEIKFNLYGVESISFPQLYETEKLNIIRSIVNELSIGTHLQRNGNPLPAFVGNENHLLDECATHFTTLQYDQIRDLPLDVSNRREMPVLEILLLPARKPGANVLIEKRTEHKKCAGSGNDFYTDHGLDIKVGKSATKIEITENELFKSQTEIDIQVAKVGGGTDTLLDKFTSVELKSIIPATEELADVSFSEKVSPHFYETVEQNFLP